jgi:voltage-gated sodium channel
MCPPDVNVRVYIHRGTTVIAWLRKIVDHPRTERIIMGLIVLNAVTLGLETSHAAMERFGSLLHFIDRTIIGLFVLELVARLIVHRTSFFKDGWNIFDFIVITVALAPATENRALSVLRTLRVLRLFRLITAVPTLQRVVSGLIAAIPGMVSILLLIALIYYVCAVMAVNLYGAAFPELFGTLGASLFTLFTIMTLEAWVDGVVRPIMKTHPYAWAFFIPFIIGTSFMVLNLFIGIIVNAMQVEYAKEQAKELAAEREIIQEEAAPILREIKALRGEVAELRQSGATAGQRRDGPS